MSTTIKRTLAKVEQRMNTKGRGMFAMAPADIRAGREKLMGNWPTGTPQEEIDHFRAIQSQIWDGL
jgi:hypothetical protein